MIWEIIRDFFESQRLPDRRRLLHQLRAAGRRRCSSGHIDIAWNSPLAWLDAQRRSGGTCRAIAMRDTDRDRVVASRRARRTAGSRRWPTCAGETVAVGAHGFAAGDADSARPAAAARARRRARISRSVRFDVLVGKHGDHIGGELDALPVPGARRGGRVRHARPQLGGVDARRHDRRRRSIGIAGARPSRFDHCVFTVRRGFPRRGGAALARGAVRDALRQSRSTAR